MVQVVLQFLRGFADEALVLAVQRGGEDGDAMADALSFVAEALGVEAFGAGEQGAVFGLVARVDFQRRQFFVRRLKRRFVEVFAAVVDGELARAAVGGQVHVHF